MYLQRDRDLGAPCHFVPPHELGEIAHFLNAPSENNFETSPSPSGARIMLFAWLAFKSALKLTNQSI